MPLEIIRNDITKMHVDAIVNAANPTLLGGGGVDGAIHRAAGPRLKEACKALGGCETGEAKVTEGFDLPCKYVIHTVGPIWRGGGSGERELLASCYQNALELAKAHGCESVAFPLISSAAYGYPKAQALRVAVEAITGFLAENEMLVYIVVFTRDAVEVSEKLFRAVEQYIDDVYVEERCDAPRETLRRAYYRQQAMAAPTASAPCEAPLDLEAMLGQVDESFAQALLRKIDERGMTDAECYKRANIDRRLFHKIKNDPGYHPGKQTALAFAIALKLSLSETQALLMKAGFALSHSSKADIVVEYCIQAGLYDIFQVNELLFKFDLTPLGY